jgi:hypothetical protein
MTTAPLTEGRYSTIRDIKNGEYFRLSPKGAVYVRAEYCGGAYNKFSCHKAEDMNAERFFKGEKVVIVGFTY